MAFGNIHFRDLSSLSDMDSKHLILCATIFAPENTIEDVDEWFHELNLITNDVHITNIDQIMGNVRGDRPDDDSSKNWLITFNKATSINPVARLC